VAVPGTMAFRTVLFFNHDAGYLTRTFPDPSSPAAGDPNFVAPRTSVGNQGAQGTFGGSLAALLRVTEYSQPDECQAQSRRHRLRGLRAIPKLRRGYHHPPGGNAATSDRAIPVQAEFLDPFIVRRVRDSAGRSPRC
jgi:hypothetical protein